jgi:hypothetical protein
MQRAFGEGLAGAKAMAVDIGPSPLFSISLLSSLLVFLVDLCVTMLFRDSLYWWKGLKRARKWVEKGARMGCKGLSLASFPARSISFKRRPSRHTREAVRGGVSPAHEMSLAEEREKKKAGKRVFCPHVALSAATISQEHDSASTD